MLGVKQRVRGQEEQGRGRGCCPPFHYMGCWLALPVPKETYTTQRANAERRRWSVPSGGLVPEGRRLKSLQPKPAPQNSRTAVRYRDRLTAGLPWTDASQDGAMLAPDPLQCWVGI